MTGDVSGDLTGRRLGNYRIDGVLGKGGMSVMYKATDVRLGRKVALKVIGEHLGADAEFRERFVDEARNTSAIDHANIVPLYDFGELDGMLYIAMRLVDGSDLASLIGNGPMAPERAFSLLEQVADALDTLHAHGLVHLDVKPANVLVTSRESAREHVYVADFGLTRRGATGHRTRGGDFLGSPTYAAPEHLRGEPLDGRTDQYALACMLYACLTGRPPYQGDVSAVIKGHLSGEPPSLARLLGLPAPVDEILRKGMAKNPPERYSGCVELITTARGAWSSGGSSGGNRAARAPVGAAGIGQVGGQQRPVPQGEGPPMQPYGQQGQPQQGRQPQGPPPPPGPPPGYGAPPPGQPPGQAPGQPPYGPPPGMGTPPQGMPPQGPPPQGPPPGYPPQGPPGGPRFQQGKGGGKMWIVWVLAAVVVVGGGVLILVLALGGEGNEGGQNPPQETTRSAPDIPVGPGGSQPSTPPSSSVGNEPPESIPVVPTN
ncbi:serine/threonine-protein kinase [Amycolatopsis cihanbeyliensis]|uniref:non-specific serine/threonine protein kinase n=1 Tax=Amycolatopsis cihanbeyliensis TaxID=1128664 RepID=A0A542DIQ4_AMYCI|nr:serine/threonine-protein kinase [Amycolatopsis cihanbeyliensis]TQJ02953.1 serine/threonine-protein kinase [Amycolatopsis cihanbeyliensis]